MSNAVITFSSSVRVTRYDRALLRRYRGRDRRLLPATICPCFLINRRQAERRETPATRTGCKQNSGPGYRPFMSACECHARMYVIIRVVGNDATSRRRATSDVVTSRRPSELELRRSERTLTTAVVCIVGVPFHSVREATTSCPMSTLENSPRRV